MSERKRKRRLGNTVQTQLVSNNCTSKYWEFNHPLNPPLNLSCAFRLDSLQGAEIAFQQYAQEDCENSAQAFVYERLNDPTVALLEEKLAIAENAECAVCFSSGMAAISAALGISLAADQEVIAHDLLYGCTYSLLTNWLPRQNIQTRFVDLRDVDQLMLYVSEKTRVIFFETPVNPTLDLIDIQAVRNCVDVLNKDRAPANKILIIVDNTFATPHCQRPLDHGAHLVLNSLTKNINGFGTDMGGVVCGAADFHRDLLLFRKDFGAVLSPRAAWNTLVYGLPTLTARLEQQQKTALQVAKFLEKHDLVSHVAYPGLDTFKQKDLAYRQMLNAGKIAAGSILYFVLKGDTISAHQAVEQMFNHVARNSTCLTLAVSLGQTHTLIEEPFYMTHSSVPDDVKQSAHLTPGGIRLSIGLEDGDDIIADLAAALDRITVPIHAKSNR